MSAGKTASSVTPGPAETPVAGDSPAVAYLRELGIAPETLAQRPEDVTEIVHRGAAGPRFVGPGVRPDMEYVRALTTDPVGTRDLIENHGFRPVEGVRYDGVASTSNELFLGRSKALAQRLRAEEMGRRQQARARSNDAAHRYGPAQRVGEPT